MEVSYAVKPLRGADACRRQATCVKGIIPNLFNCGVYYFLYILESVVFATPYSFYNVQLCHRDGNGTK